jgi:tetratricopeptide (TPR) repeat protein
MGDIDDLAEHLMRARALYGRGDDAAARAAYLDILRQDPEHFSALNELGTLAYASGHRSAARTAYEQAVRCHPQNPLGRVNLGNLKLEDEDFAGARAEYEAALVVDAELAEAHRGLARALTALGEAARAEPHWVKGYAGDASLSPQRYRGAGKGIPVLLLVSAKGGNIPTQRFLDDRIFALTVLTVEYFPADRALPESAVVFNSIGDAELCAHALDCAEAICARAIAPVVNPPARIHPTTRAEVARRLAIVPGVKTPATQMIARAELANRRDLNFPLLLRAPGFHTGRHFERVERPDDVHAALARLPGETLLAIEYLDARGADGFARKYRVMFIDGALYPLHLAVSSDWKVHYFTAGMADHPEHREEERSFLEDMEGTLGPRAVAALSQIAAVLRLDYGGIDFGLDADGNVLLFEANATMVINLPDQNPIWDYRRAPISRALEAAKSLVCDRAIPQSHSGPAER